MFDLEQTMAALKSRTARISYPFQANPDDHCETSADAYRDVVPVLDLLAGRLKKVTRGGGGASRETRIRLLENIAFNSNEG